MIRTEWYPHNGGLGNKLLYHFLNGDIIVNTDSTGAYCIAPGCGSGKTTLIKDTIRLGWCHGVLYSAFTKNEVNEMFQYCKSLIGSTIYDKAADKEVTLTEDDIIVLHSDYKAEGTNCNLWRNRPEEIASKKIVLCTHAKLLNEPVELLISTNFNTHLAAYKYSPRYRAINGLGGSLPRQLVLIDEMTESKLSIGVLDNLLMSVISDLDHLRVLNPYDAPSRYIWNQLPDDAPFRRKREADDYMMFRKIVISVAGAMKEIADKYPYLRRTDRLSQIKTDRLVGMLFDNFYPYEYEFTVNHKIPKLTSSFTDLVNPDGSCAFNLLLFDGTGDITLKNSTKFRLLTFDNKYSSPVRMFRFPFRLKRNVGLVGNSIEETDQKIREDLDSIISGLVNIIKMNKKTLIFTWKNLKTESDYEGDDVDFDGKIINATTVDINPKFSMPSYISSSLRSTGLMEDIDFSIEYYGSGRDKATNDYRDYDAVVLLGRYLVPNSVIDDFNTMYYTKITTTEYYTNRVVQAICRTRIRNHKGEPINVFFSSDWSNDVVESTMKYLKVSDIRIVNNLSKDDYISYATQLLMDKGITPKKAEQMAKLGSLDNNIVESVLSDKKYNCTLKLSDVYEVLPASRYKVDRYDPLVASLHELGIDVAIESNYSKFTEVDNPKNRDN